MVLAQSKVTAQGQISVPAEIRKKLGIDPGSVLEWDEQSGEVIVQQGRSTYFTRGKCRAIRWCQAEIAGGCERSD